MFRPWREHAVARNVVSRSLTVLRCSLNLLSDYCREPISRKNKPRRTRMRSMTLLRRFFSWKRSAPQRNDTITLERRIMETMETMEALWARETK